MTDRPPILVVGEALLDVIVDQHGRRTAHPGGSPANVAVGLARLGDEVSLLTDLGDDDEGLRVRRHLAGAGVVVLSPDRPGRPTSTATARLNADGSARYEFAVAWDPEVSMAPQAATVLHAGSLGAVLGDDRIVALLAGRRGRSLISYDPNIRPDAMGAHAAVLTRVEELVSLSDLVKVSDEDLDWLYPSARVEDVARRWAERGPEAVVITRGPAGALALVDGSWIERAPVAATVVDTVGAGDSFMAALLHFLVGAGVHSGDQWSGHVDWTAALTFAATAAAVTVCRAGADLPSLADVDALLE